MPRKNVTTIGDDPNETNDTQQPSKKKEVLRVSFFIRNSDLPRIQWMMDVLRLPTKVDLLREALNRLENQLVDEEAARADKRRAAGAPALVMTKLDALEDELLEEESERHGRRHTAGRPAKRTK